MKPLKSRNRRLVVPLGSLIIILLALMVFTPASSQQVRIKGGLNLATMFPREKYEHSSITYPLNPGFQVGGAVEMPLSKRFSIEPGLSISSKGYKKKNIQYTSVLTYTMKTDIHFIYLEVPVLAKATIKKSRKKYYAEAGPYVGLALLGNYKRETIVENNTQAVTTSDEGKIEWLSGGGDYQRLDYGLMVGAGVEIRSVSFGLTYGLGLAKNRPDSDSYYHQRNSVIGLSAGYRF